MPPTFPLSNYWLRREGDDVSVPYRPPVCHGDFMVMPDEPRPIGQRIGVALRGLFGNQNVVVERVIRVLEVYLVNAELAVRNLTLRSPSFGPAILEGGGAEQLVAAPHATDPLFSLPLSCDDPNPGDVAQTVWSDNTRLHVVVNTGGTLAFGLRFILIGATGGVVSSADRTCLALLQAGYQDAAFVGQPNDLGLRIPLADLLAALGVGALNPAPAASPYKLQVSSIYEERRCSSAWTYFYVPYASEVKLLERFAAQRVLFQRGNMPDFAGFGATAASFAGPEAIAQVVAAPPPQDGPYAPGEAFLYLTAAERATIDAMLSARTLEAKIAQNHSNIVGLQNSPLDPAIVERRRMDFENQRLNNLRLQGLVEEVRAAGANIDAHDMRASLASREMYDQNSMNILVEREGGYFLHLSWGTTAVFRRHAGTGRYYLERLYIASYLAGSNRSLSVVDLARNMASFGAVDGAPVDYGDPNVLPTAVVQANSTVPHSVILTGNILVRGVRAPRTLNWSVFDFAPMQFPIASAITYGVSACSASTTFTNEAVPEVIIFAHIDGGVLPPYQSAIQWVRDAGNVHGPVASTDFRSINLMIAEMDELDTYSRDVLFPAPGGLGGVTHESIFCPRESNLWGFDAGQIARGYDATGLAFEAGGTAPVMVGVYGQRSFSRTSMINYSAAARQRVGVARKALFDAQRSVYGTLPDVLAPFDVANVEPWQAFLAEAHAQCQSNQAMVGALPGTAFHRLREQVIAQRTVFRLQNVGSGLYDQMLAHGQCRPLAASNFVVMDNTVLGWLTPR